jgi:hypothetical protein
MTKYPEIPTYHRIGEKGILTEEQNVDFKPYDTVIITEKIDGTNGRIIFLPDGYLIGSREELLYASGDLLANHNEGIVEALRPIAERIKSFGDIDLIATFYFEVYGGNLPATRKYTCSKKLGCRLFDYSYIENYDELVTKPLEWFSGWRERKGQFFGNEGLLQRMCDKYNLQLAPRLAALSPNNLLGNVSEGIPFLQQFGGTIKPLNIDFRTRAALDGEPGRAEGVVVRSIDRQVIAKIRFEDYERTMKQRRKETK